MIYKCRDSLHAKKYAKISTYVESKREKWLDNRFLAIIVKALSEKSKPRVTLGRRVTDPQDGRAAEERPPDTSFSGAKAPIFSMGVFCF